MALAVDIRRRFLDVEDERASRVENALQFVGDGHEPRRIVVGFDSAIGGRTLIGVGWRR